MSNDILVGILALLGTVIGTVGGIVTSNKLIGYRIEQLEKKVDKHNQVVERTYRLEEDVTVIKKELDENVTSLKADLYKILEILVGKE